MKNLIALSLVASALGAFSCATNAANERETEAIRAANAQATFTPTQPKRDDRLAVEVEITEAGVQPVGATILRTVPPASSAMEDLRVRAMADGRVVSEYSMADPRFVELENQKWQVLPSARTIVFLPLSAEITALEIVPMPGKARASRGGRMDVRELARRACSERRNVEKCRPLLGPQ